MLLVALSHPLFWGEGSPTKIYYLKAQLQLVPGCWPLQLFWAFRYEKSVGLLEGPTLAKTKMALTRKKQKAPRPCKKVPSEGFGFRRICRRWPSWALRSGRRSSSTAHLGWAFRGGGRTEFVQAPVPGPLVKVTALCLVTGGFSRRKPRWSSTKAG